MRKLLRKLIQALDIIFNTAAWSVNICLFLVAVSLLVGSHDPTVIKSSGITILVMLIMLSAKHLTLRSSVKNQVIMAALLLLGLSSVLPPMWYLNG